MTQEIIDMAQECGLIGMRPHLDGIYSEALVAFAKLVAERALADPMREVQRLGQEIEQEPCVHAKTPKGCYRVRCQVGDKCVDDEMSFRTTPPQPEQEPVALPCCGYTDASAVKWNPFNGVVQCHNCGQTYTPAQRSEPEPTCPECKAEVLYECVACSSNNYPPKETT
jgi:hypothetical protein